MHLFATPVMHEPNPIGAAAPASQQRVFVLVHGGFHGGWCWDEVALRLRALGHVVHAPTQTGCGERAQLLTRSITLDTFVEDITEVFLREDLHDVVLVGHSFGGSAISGVADRMPERVSQLIYLDAIMLDNGKTTFDLLDPDAVQSRLNAAQASGGLAIAPPPAGVFGISDPAQLHFVQARLTSHPLGAYTSPLKLAHPVGNGLPAVYLQCTDPIYAALQSSRDWVDAHGMQRMEIATGHDAMISAPGLLVEMLVRIAA